MRPDHYPTVGPKTPTWPDIEKALRASDLSFNPQNDGKTFACQCRQ